MEALSCIDIGNQQLKHGIFSTEGILQKVEIVPSSESIQYIESLPHSIPLCISDVTGAIASQESVWAGQGRTLFMPQPQSNWPFKVAYNSPQTLGIDRLCGLSGARFYNPEGPCLVISLGTCITIDWIDPNNLYHGGNISPGMTLRYRSMGTFTSSLPFLQFKYEKDLLGSDTEKAIHAGVQRGIVAEIEYYIDQIRSNFPETSLFLSGGDATHFVDRIKTQIFAAPYLNLYGLYNAAQRNEII